MIEMEDIIRDLTAVGIRCFDGSYSTEGSWMLKMYPHDGCTFNIIIFKIIFYENRFYKVKITQKNDSVDKLLFGDEEMAGYLKFAIDLIKKYMNKEYPITDEELNDFLRSDTSIQNP